MRPLRRKGVPLASFGVRKKVLPRRKKEEKIIYETKEEKTFHETKDFSDLSIKKLTEKVKEMTLEDLADLLKDSRVSAIKLAQEEIKKRVEG